VFAALAVGVAFVLLARRRLTHDGRFDRTRGAGARRSLLVFGVLLVHSLPEGFAVGAAWAAPTAGLGLFVVLAIGIQNVPEGTAIAIPMDQAGYSHAAQVWASILSSAPQPVGAAVAYVLVEQVDAILPVSLAFAAGAMLAVVAAELVPDAWRGARRPAVAGALAGSLAMLGLSAALGV
jgi:ZIP family zinc transporter